MKEIKNLIKILYSNLECNSVLNYFIVAYCSFMIFAPPYFVTFVPSIIKTPLRLFAIFIIIVSFIVNVISKKKISYLFILSTVFCLYLVIVTYFKKGAMIYALYSNMFLVISAIALFELYNDSKFNSEFYLINYIILTVSITIFLLVLLIDYDLYARMYYRNSYIIFYLTFILIQKKLTLIKNDTRLNMLSNISIFVILIITILTNARTSLVCIIIYIIFEYLFFQSKKNYKFLSIFNDFKLYFLLLALIFIFMLFLKPDTQIVHLIGSIFNKYDSLNARIKIYNFSKELIRNSMIFGYGCQNDVVEIGNAHNFVFQYLIDGGLIGMIMMFSTIFCVIKKVDYSNSINLKRYLLFMIFLFLLRNMFEAIGLNYLYFYLSNINFFDNENKKLNFFIKS